MLPHERISFPGLLPATPAQPRLRLSPYLTSRLTEPAPIAADFLSNVRDWDMHDNDRIGNCGPISLANAIEAAGQYGDGTPYAASTSQIIDFYSRVSGFDPVTGSNDNGVVMSEMLNVARKMGGPGGQRVYAFASVNVSDFDEMKAALNAFGHLLFGLNLPIDASYQLDAGKPWDATSGPNGIPGSWGGHAVEVGQYDDAGFTCVTWGRTQRMTNEFVRRNLGEAWVIVTPEWFNEVGKTPAGLDLHGLGAEFARLTGEANPFPATPTPAPEPAPVDQAPADVVADPTDVAFWSGVRSWASSRRVGANKEAQRLVKQWAEQKGLA